MLSYRLDNIIFVCTSVLPIWIPLTGFLDINIAMSKVSKLSASFP